jgi:hypothetical protein
LNAFALAVQADVTVLAKFTWRIEWNSRAAFGSGITLAPPSRHHGFSNQLPFDRAFSVPL